MIFNGIDAFLSINRTYFVNDHNATLIKFGRVIVSNKKISRKKRL